MGRKTLLIDPEHHRLAKERAARAAMKLHDFVRLAIEAFDPGPPSENSERPRKRTQQRKAG